MRNFKYKILFQNNIGEKPFKCDKCPLSFNYKHILINHQRTHGGFFFLKKLEKVEKNEKIEKLFTPRTDVCLRVHLPNSVNADH